MILNQPPAVIIQQLWEVWLSCDKSSLKCHSSAGIESGTWVKSIYCPILFFLLAVHKWKRSKASTQPPQILRLLGRWCGQSRITYSHFRLGVTAKQAAVAIRIIFLQARIVQHAQLCSSTLSIFIPTDTTPNQKKNQEVINLGRLSKGMT